MCGSEAISKIVDELEFLDAERRQLKANGPHFRIVHRSPQPFAPCSLHEKAAVFLIHHGQMFQVGLGTTVVKLFDYMARHNRLAQTAREIENGIRAQREWSGLGGAALASGISTRYVRVYAGRIRAALGLALRNAGLEINPNAVLTSEGTALNEVGYRLRGTFEWLHIA